MVDDNLVLTAERLLGDLGELRRTLRKKYSNPKRQVTDDTAKAKAALLAEKWMVDLNLGKRVEVNEVIPSDYLADLTVHFQRLLRFSEGGSQRARYDSEIVAILRDSKARLIIPLKQLLRESAQNGNPRGAVASPSPTGEEASRRSFEPTAFVAHSFEPTDREVSEYVIRTSEAIGIKVLTGEKPKADRISEKIKGRIERQHLFVAIFTRRAKLASGDEWTTSAWLVDEKAYAFGKGKTLILFRERGVESIGGIQGDYEFIEFDRGNLHELGMKMLQLFDLAPNGLRS